MFIHDSIDSFFPCLSLNCFLEAHSDLPQYSVPRSPVKVWLCIVYGSLVICLASSRALGQFYRIHEDALIEVREEVVEIVAKAAK